MELLEKTSTPQYKRCSHCGETKPSSEFSKDRRNKSGLRRQCKECCKQYRQSEQGKLTIKLYLQSDKSKLRNIRYEQSEGGKLTRKRYSQSEERKLVYRRYWQSDKGKLLTRRANHSEKGRLRQQRYRYSEKGKLRDERSYRSEAHANYVLSGRQAEYAINRYHRIQDEAGCHRHIDSFYPGYRFIQALANAKVGDIEVY